MFVPVNPNLLYKRVFRGQIILACFPDAEENY